MRQKILEALLKITDEEQAFLNGKEPSAEDKETGSLSPASLLKEGKLVGIVPHARFMRSAKHTHDYIELVYQYCGQTTHIINGEYISLNEGEFLLLPTDSSHEVLPAGANDIAINFVILPRFFKKTFQATGRENNTPLQQFILQIICDAKSTVDFLHFDVRELFAVSNLIDSILWTHLEYAPQTGEIVEKALELILLYLIDFST
ncbi:MAG: AraC family ligand binding domain-containing protein, partial [Oscillospiraceae bacterium]|nr:AraC family ligand binding domain-containing protein [Oscillospiraceae bacterium]